MTTAMINIQTKEITMEGNTLQIACHGHPVMHGNADSMRVIFALITEKARHAPGHRHDTPIDIAYANYLAWMTVKCGCLITYGTPVALVTHDGTTMEKTTVDAPFTEAYFDTPEAVNCYQQAKLARAEGLPKLKASSGDRSVMFAVDYGWLAGTRFPESDAWLASQAMLARNTAQTA